MTGYCAYFLTRNDCAVLDILASKRLIFSVPAKIGVSCMSGYKKHAVSKFLLFSNADRVF